jgi:regulator of protease activity HflC (stomatin/prohibitin superfamily)
MNVISDRETIRDPVDAEALSSGQAHRQRPARALSGGPAADVAVATLVLSAALIAIGASNSTPHLAIIGVWLAAIALVLSRGFVVIAPNQARVLILFGRYTGTVSETGLWWVHPFTAFSRITISLRVRNFQSEPIKVNDLSGNPIEIAAVIVWRVIDTAKAAFDVENFEQFVTVQSETAVRNLAGQYPYDDYEPDVVSLRANTDEVGASLQSDLQSRLHTAGIEILETRLTHLAYAPEIADAMLRRQQAEAILAARKTMVQGAVGLVQMALAQLTDSDLIELDPERKAAMASSLMVVLSGDQAPMPVINTSSLYT